jgi:dTDP-4-amino-4,6-dideoxygalactose transaminase
MARSTRVVGLGLSASFYPGKNLGAYGEGGMVTTNNPDYAKSVRMLRDWGQQRKYEHSLRGYNYRMDELQGAILRVKLRHLETWTEARRENAIRYNELLSDNGIKIPHQMPYAHHVYHIYAIRSPNRDVLHQSLRAQGIQTGIHYPNPVHLQEAHVDLGYRPGDFPYSEQAAAEVLSLPMFAELTAEQQKEVASAICRERTQMSVL